MLLNEYSLLSLLIIRNTVTVKGVEAGVETFFFFSFSENFLFCLQKLNDLSFFNMKTLNNQTFYYGQNGQNFILQLKILPRQKPGF